MALDGVTGNQLWIQFTPHEIIDVNCQFDLTNDGINDCIAVGRMAVSKMQT